MTSPTSTLRPLGIGELMDRSVRVWRAHLWPLTRAMLPYALVGHVLLQVLVSGLLEPQLAALSPDGSGGDPLVLLGTLASMAGGFCLYGLVTWMGYVAVSRSGLPMVLGSDAAGLPGELPRGFPLARAAGLYAIVLAVLALVMALSFLPVVGLAFGAAMLNVSGSFATLALTVAIVGVSMLLMLGAMLWVMLRFLFAPQVLAAEQLGLWRTVRRTGSLISGRIGPGWMGLVGLRATILVTVMGAVLSSVQLLASMPMIGLQLAFREAGSGRLSSETVPWALRLPAEVVQILSQSATGPLFVLFCVVFYVDMRVRREGLDLELELARTKAAA
jgi:hypothetical protein